MRCNNREEEEKKIKKEKKNRNGTDLFADVGFWRWLKNNLHFAPFAPKKRIEFKKKIKYTPEDLSCRAPIGLNKLVGVMITLFIIFKKKVQNLIFINVGREKKSILSGNSEFYTNVSSASNNSHLVCFFFCVARMLMYTNRTMCCLTKEKHTHTHRRWIVSNFDTFEGSNVPFNDANCCKQARFFL